MTVYVLSAVPMSYFAARSGGTSDAEDMMIRVAYYPLILCDQTSEQFHRFVEWEFEIMVWLFGPITSD